MGVDIAVNIDKFLRISLYRGLSISLYVSCRRHPYLMNSQTFCMLGWPCIMNYMYNNQLDALIILNLLNYHTSTCFGCINSPSSGVITYICGKWCLLYFYVSRLSAGLDGMELTVTLEVKQVPFATYIRSTSWWWDTPETCRGVII
jgi:hypothetical protein